MQYTICETWPIFRECPLPANFHNYNFACVPTILQMAPFVQRYQHIEWIRHLCLLCFVILVLWGLLQTVHGYSFDLSSCIAGITYTRKSGLRLCVCRSSWLCFWDISSGILSAFHRRPRVRISFITLATYMNIAQCRDFRKFCDFADFAKITSCKIRTHKVASNCHIMK